MSDKDIQAGEPTLDDILSSLRKILAESEDEHDFPSEVVEGRPFTAIDDGPVAPVAPISAKGTNRAAPEAGRAPVEVSGSGETVGQEDDVFELTAEMIVSPEDVGYDDDLISAHAKAIAGSMIADLASTVARERNIAVGNSGLSLEMLVRDVLRELLRNWLDRNLPGMTEQIVYKEIHRLVDRVEKS